MAEKTISSSIAQGKPFSPEILDSVGVIQDARGVFVSSLLMAEHFGISHKNVLCDIKTVMRKVPESFTELNFEPSEYLDSTGRKLPFYHLTRDGFTLLAMGYNSVRAIQWKLRYIEAFNALERAVLEQARQAALCEGLLLRERMTPERRVLARRAVRYKSLGLSHRETGKLLECSHSTVKSLLEDAGLLGLEAAR